ncbi:hypothetical protein [Streptomyces spiramyceticus]|uniref:hypothetical protein n=1 Tax=Streptomyces spiramyceticus TaxID=299717 RepID=UPI00237BB3D1|nr:hypothetical protein [Streptomyces spiramyceticus]
MRFAPLTGLLAVLFTVVAFLLIGDTPSVDAPADEVRTFYADHEAQGLWSLFLLVVAGALFVFFAAFLARALHQSPVGNGWLHHVIVAGGVLIAAGFWVGSSIALALVDLADEAAAGNDTLQALHALSEDFFIPFVAGVAVMLLAAGLTVVRAAVSPCHAGWAGSLSPSAC